MPRSLIIFRRFISSLNAGSGGPSFKIKKQNGSSYQTSDTSTIPTDLNETLPYEDPDVVLGLRTDEEIPPENSPQSALGHVTFAPQHYTVML